MATDPRIEFTMDEQARTASIKAFGPRVPATTSWLVRKANALGGLYGVNITQLDRDVQGTYTMCSAGESTHFDAVGSVIAAIVETLGWSRAETTVIENREGDTDQPWSLGNDNQPDWAIIQQPVA